MDIYRFFHPHHNPRLVCTPIRQIELVELEQAASELRKAIARARHRIEKRPIAPIQPDHFSDLLKALDYVSKSLHTLCDAHPGDNDTDLADLVEERARSAGWETWATLLQEQLASAGVPARLKTGS